MNGLKSIRYQAFIRRGFSNQNQHLITKHEAFLETVLG